MHVTTVDRFHSSDNILSENAAYQLVSRRICQKRSYKEFECSTVRLQYIPILNAPHFGKACYGTHTNDQKVICVE